MHARIKLPCYSVEVKNMNILCFTHMLYFLIIIVIPIIGYFMNFQNLYEYFPPFTAFENIESFCNNVSMKFVISCVGVFFAPVGIITGIIL